MRILVVTAADEAFLPLLRGLVLSLHQWQPLPFTALGVLDLGLAPASRQWVVQFAQHVAEPRWDLPVDAERKAAQPHLRAMTARPFLRDYFPGYDIYLWLDADTWVQERFALDWLVRAAAGGAAALVPEADRSYLPQPAIVQWRHDRQATYFGAAAGQRALWDRYFNSGVVALPAAAPHWTQWARYLALGIQASHGRQCSDQAALNQAIWEGALPVVPLPALCNWLCHSAMPAWRSDIHRFCEPHLPWLAIGILHLVGDTKDRVLKIKRHAVDEEVTLRFPVRGRNG